MTTAQSELKSTRSSSISGFVKPGFEAVREAFVENFECRNKLGAACCIYYRGEKVVDLLGGIRNEATGGTLLAVLKAVGMKLSVEPDQHAAA